MAIEGIRQYFVSELIVRGVLAVGDGYRAKNSELSAEGLPFARGSNINDGFKFEDADRFPAEQLWRVGGKVSRPGDVVFTSKGTVGRFAFVAPSVPTFVFSPQLCYWRSLRPEVIDPRFLYYWVQGREFFLQYNGVKGQTDMADYVSLQDQRRMHITLPPVAKQRAIAGVLGALDDKIELNRQMNQTLEAMARALFKSWFVDFDPVRAKSEGRQPWGMDAETAALFPREFEDSELGEIPKGWRVGTLGDVLVFHDSKRVPLSAAERRSRPGTFRYYGATAVMDHVDDFLFDGAFVLMGEDGSVQTDDGAPVLQYVWGKFWVNNHAHVLRALGAMTVEHLFLMLSASDVRPFVTGAVQPKLSQGNTRRIGCVLAPDAIHGKFGDALAPLFAVKRHNDESIDTLAELRDTLLPKLLSGEVRVRDAERAVEAVV